MIQHTAKPPNKRFLEQVQMLRYNLASTCACIRAQNYETVDLEGLLQRVMEDADSVLGAGEIPGWEELHKIMRGTLGICQEFLK